ncbi:hypothetical protein CCH79_00018102 [Gambusia affinis]|uniref:B30.2/SPRY domain-containing protein n=1 Tax=Gambusia affinis TaxID=33528 RepID=A0A315UNF6_GAMAF|nr:hypothetical protein CCH79_00018102 [Gambusia affinis]
MEQKGDQMNQNPFSCSICQDLPKDPSYSSHPGRFTSWWQVLSRESLTGRCYWEVEWRGRGAYIAASCKNISRAGNECGFGRNDKSWALDCHQNSFTFWYNNTATSISVPQSCRVGVYLDHRAGLLSFYSVSKTLTLLHRVQTRFTQPLHAGVWLYICGSSAEFKGSTSCVEGVSGSSCRLPFPESFAPNCLLA